MTGIIRNKHQFIIDDQPHFASAADDFPFKVSIKRPTDATYVDRLVIDTIDRSGSTGNNGEPLSPLGKITLYGDLEIIGQYTAVSSTNLTIQDNVIVLNKDQTGTGVSSGTAGIEVERGDSPNTSWIYDETNDWWGPYGQSPLTDPHQGSVNIDGPTKTLGNINQIDATTAGYELLVDAGRLVINDADGFRDHSLLQLQPDGDLSNTARMVRVHNASGGGEANTLYLQNYVNNVRAGDISIRSDGSVYVTGDGSGAGHIYAHTTTPAAPAYSFLTQENSGLSLDNTTAELILVQDSVKALAISKPNVSPEYVRLDSQYSLESGYGSIANPGYTFNGDNDTGMARTATNEITLVGGGDPQLRLNGTVAEFTVGTLTQSGNLYIGGTSNLNGAVTMNSTLDVSGNTNLASNLTVGGNGSFGGSLSVSSSASVGGNLTVSGTTSMYGRLNAYGGISMGDGLDMNGNNIHDSGSITPRANNTYHIGAAALRYHSVWATTFEGTATAARYSDLAERYAADTEYSPGTVLVFGGDAEVTVTTTEMDRSVAGVVSTAPAHLMNSAAGTDKTHPAIALKGRVPCLVVGTIHKGDLLVTSTIPGVGMAADEPRLGSVFAKAMEDYDSFNVGIIEVFLASA